MSDRANHPDFDAAPEERRWTGTLPQLADHLKHEAYKLRGKEAWVVLPGGALVAMRIDETTFRKQLRIARRLRKPFTEKSAAAWSVERTTFLEQLGCKDWSCRHGALYAPPDQAKGVAATIGALYVEPAPLGAKIEKCARCGQPADKGPYKEALCTSCAMKAGQEEVDAAKQA